MTEAKDPATVRNKTVGCRTTEALYDACVFQAALKDLTLSQWVHQLVEREAVTRPPAEVTNVTITSNTNEEAMAAVDAARRRLLPWRSRRA